jgi:hypothetical protein
MEELGWRTEVFGDHEYNLTNVSEAESARMAPLL